MKNSCETYRLCITLFLSTRFKSIRKVRWEMDFANRGNKPSQGAPQHPAGNQTNEQPAQSFQPVNNNNNDKKKGGFNFTKIATSILVLAGLVLLIAVLVGIVFGESPGNKESDQILDDKYQAVFLDSSDGQVYFGNLSVHNSDLYALTDIYYVRVENPIQPEGADQPAQPNISLAKLGNELHGPMDVMYINRDKVLYWENLKDDGQVVTAITQYIDNGGEEAEQQPVDSGTQPAETPETDDTSGAEETPTP